MEELLNSIKADLDYLINNTDNQFIIDTCNMIDDKLNQIRNRTIISQESLNYFCDYIINKDINKMKRVISDETKMEYTKMDELATLISEIKEKYFEN